MGKVLKFEAGFLVETDVLAEFVAGEVPAGAIDGANRVFTTATTFTPTTLSVYRNGQLQTKGSDYTISESGGAGTGFDTVTFAVPCTPKTGGVVLVNYVPTP